jgi:polyhydroxyalkanoate synthesis regulator phasin
MSDLMKKMLLASVGLVAVSKEKAQKIIEPLVKKGQLSENQGRRLLDQLVKKSEQARKGLEKTIDRIARKTLSRMDIPTKQDYLDLSCRIDKLEKKGKTKARAKRKTSVKPSVTKKQTTT